MGFISDALQSGSVLLREGLEAILVIAALAAFLRKAGADGAIRWLYVGALGGILASLAAAAAFEAFFDGTHDDRIEAVVLVFAAAMMLYMSGWLFLRQNPAAWTADLKHAATSVGPRATLSMAMIAFLAVLREGAETALFLHATARTSSGWTLGILSGIGVAFVILILLVVAIVWLAVRLPLRPMFIATSAFLFLMGLKFIGAAIQECQEQVLLPVHPADLPRWLIDLGLNPSWEALSAQVLIAAVAFLGLLVMLRVRPAPMGQHGTIH